MRVYNRARALNKLARLFLDRIRKVNVPDQVSYDNLSKFAQETQKAFLVTDIDIKNWFPRISPFFIMDRRKFLAVHEKAKARDSRTRENYTRIWESEPLRTPISGAQFRRDVKLAQKRGKDMGKLREVILLLIEGNLLLARYKDHPLAGRVEELSRLPHRARLAADLQSGR